MSLIKGKYTIVCKWLNGQIELAETNEYFFVEKDNSISFMDLNNPRVDPNTGEKRLTNLPRLLCKIEGGEIPKISEKTEVSQ